MPDFLVEVQELVNDGCTLTNAIDYVADKYCILPDSFNIVNVDDYREWRREIESYLQPTEVFA
jgi:hypothetical protein